MNNLITSEKYNIIECEDIEAWDKFISESLNPTIFCLSKYLNYTNCTSKKIFIRKKKQIVAGISLICSENYENVITSNKIIYTPIIYSKDIFLNRSKGTINSENYNIVAAVYSYLTMNFKSIDITFDYHTKDIRPFMWHEYYNKNERFVITPKFTSIFNLKNENLKTYYNEDYLLNLTKTKRYEIKKALSSKYSIINKVSKDDISRMLLATFEKQGLDIEDEYDTNTLSDLLDELEKNKLIKNFATVDENNKVLNFITVSIINETSQLLYSGRSFDNDISFLGTFIHSETIKKLIEMGIKYIDLEGINSPKRAFFKISLGGKINNYYNLKLNR